jgi:hypothetical protein
MIVNGLLSCSFVAILVSSGFMYGVPPIDFGLSQNISSFAQSSDQPNNGTLDSLGGASSVPPPSSVQLNRYENDELGVSLKYPSTFLIDESNLNQTLKQVSFFPVDNVSEYPEKYIRWMDVFVQPLNASQYNLDSLPSPSSVPDNVSTSSPSKSNNTAIESFMEKLANDIQQQNEDVTILNASTDAMLSGHPAYKLITRSYFQNSTIDESQIGTIVDNTLYSLNFETDSSNYSKSLPIADLITESFKIEPSMSSVADAILSLSPQTGTGSDTVPPLNSTTDAIPLLLDRILSSLKSDLRIDEITNNSRELKNLETSVNSLLANSKNKLDQSLANTTSLPPSADSVQEVCNLPLISKLCEGVNELGNRGGINNLQPQNYIYQLTNQSNIDSVQNELRDLLASLHISDNSTQQLNPTQLDKLVGTLRSFSNTSGLSDSPAVISSLFSKLLSSSTSPSSPSNSDSPEFAKSDNFLNFNRTETESAIKQHLNNGTNEVLRMFEFLTSR